MGRETKAKNAEPMRIALPRDAYWELRARIRDVEAIQLDAMKAAQEFGQRALAAKQRADALLVHLGKAHGFDASKTWGWDDETGDLIEQASAAT